MTALVGVIFVLGGLGFTFYTWYQLGQWQLLVASIVITVGKAIIDESN